MTSLHSFPFDALGTECVIHLYADSVAVANGAADAAIAEVERIEGAYSRYREDSTLAAINRAAARGESIKVDDETASLLDYAFACHRMSGGLFDITSGILRRAWDFSAGRPPATEDVAALLPHIGMARLAWQKPHLSFPTPGMELDFGGLGKEYAADRAAAVCRAWGIGQGLIDLGGDLCILGPHPDGSPWRVGIRDPRAPARAIAIVELSAGALASSGDYERYLEHDSKRYCHILDPHTGWPVQGLSSVSVHAGQCLLAGSLSTIAMLMGEQGKAWLADFGVEHQWVDATGRQGGTLAAHGRP